MTGNKDADWFFRVVLLPLGNDVMCLSVYSFFFFPDNLIKRQVTKLGEE